MADDQLLDRVGSLSRFPVFSGLDSTHLAAFAAIARPKKLSRKETLFREGDAATGFFLLLKGRIKLFKLGSAGKEQIIHFVNEGNSFAEAALYMQQIYPVFAEALEDSELLFIPKDELTRLLETDSTLAVNLIAHLAHYLQLLTRKVEELSLMDATSRLCRHLASNLDPETGTVKLSAGKGQTASSLGMAVETFSRTLTRLKEEGVVEESKGGVIRILDRDALDRYGV